MQIQRSATRITDKKTKEKKSNCIDQSNDDQKGIQILSTRERERERERDLLRPIADTES